jgi:hypothetical protein
MQIIIYYLYIIFMLLNINKDKMIFLSSLNGLRKVKMIVCSMHTRRWPASNTGSEKPEPKPETEDLETGDRQRKQMDRFFLKSFCCCCCHTFPDKSPQVPK